MTINTNSTWSISIPSNIDWVRFLGNNVNINGFGSSTFAINLQSNIASSTRIAKLNVNCGGFISELSIVQEGRTGSNCNISPSLMSFSDQAGSQYFSISSSSNWSLSTSSGTTGWWSILDNGIEKNLTYWQFNQNFGTPSHAKQ
ncbi:MAG: BACON domain-containing protein [Saprospiraceae bacterium]|nr:BACON domain-containing protein [Candidatus Vicinibacter affinis]